MTDKDTRNFHFTQSVGTNYSGEYDIGQELKRKRRMYFISKLCNLKIKEAFRGYSDYRRIKKIILYAEVVDQDICLTKWTKRHVEKIKKNAVSGYNLTISDGQTKEGFVTDIHDKKILEILDLSNTAYIHFEIQTNEVHFDEVIEDCNKLLHNLPGGVLPVLCSLVVADRVEVFLETSEELLLTAAPEEVSLKKQIWNHLYSKFGYNDSMTEKQIKKKIDVAMKMKKKHYWKVAQREELVENNKLQEYVKSQGQ